MTDRPNKVFENRVRRMAERQGLRLHKSRRRDPRAADYGTYWLNDPRRRNVLVAGDEFGWTLVEIEAWLLRDDDEVAA